MPHTGLQSTMNACSICRQAFGPGRKGCCVSCARTTLYSPRIQQVTSLLEHENFHTHVEAIVSPGNDGVLASLPQDANWDAIAQGIKADSLAKQRQEVDSTNDRIARVVEQAEELRRQITQYHDRLDAKKAANSRRRIDLESKKQELCQLVATGIEPWEVVTKKTRRQLHRVHQKTAGAKAFLCYSASWLAGVRQETDTHRKLTGRVTLAGIPVPDLRELSGPPPDASVVALPFGSAHHQQINSCLDKVCRLVAIWANYLSICLPAEILLPHSDFPHAAVLHERSSYRGYEIPYPGTVASTEASPSTSRILSEVQNLPRPRLLQLDRPLAKLAKEEPKAFSLFVEGVVLLAWDLAWLCKTQGITAINTFDEFCDLGRNLWLFHRAAEMRAHDNVAVPPNADTASRASRATSGHAVQFADLTHGTALHSLASHEGAAALQNWRLAQPHRLIDKLRSFLLAEMTGAEWDVLSERDFDDAREDEVAVLVGGIKGKRPGSSKIDAMSVMSIAPAETTDGVRPEKGWMRVRDRATES